MKLFLFFFSFQYQYYHFISHLILRLASCSPRSKITYVIRRPSPTCVLAAALPPFLSPRWLHMTFVCFFPLWIPTKRRVAFPRTVKVCYRFHVMDSTPLPLDLGARGFQTWCEISQSSLHQKEEEEKYRILFRSKAIHKIWYIYFRWSSDTSSYNM